MNHQNKYIILGVIILIALNIYSQDVNNSHLLINKWYLDKYLINNKFYLPKENESGDYLFLQNDSTYESVDEGIKENGRWTYNQNDQVIVLFDSIGNDSIIFNVLHLSEDEFVYSVDIKFGFDILVFMKSRRIDERIIKNE